jgi:hypothetical protein
VRPVRPPGDAERAEQQGEHGGGDTELPQVAGVFVPGIEKEGPLGG